jgi:signal transduction histidine kinase
VTPDRARALTRQSLLVAAVCLTVDGLSYLVRGPDRIGPVEVAVLVGVLVADAALATAPSRSGWVAAAHALLLPAIAVVVPDRTASTAGLLVSAYRAGAWLRGRAAAASVVVLGTGMAVALVVQGTASWPNVLLLLTANTVLPWLVGRYTTARKAYVDELRHRREVQVARAVAREREAIAADLHDVISHHVSAIGVHAAAARMRLGAGDGEVSGSLGAVETSSRAAMTDLRRLLELLHGEDAGDQPGLAQLPDLFDGVRSSGLEVSFVAYDEPLPVDPEVDLALYRTAQEMLTNARRHGAGSTVRVELEYHDDRVVLTARNRAGPANHDGTGRGLAGIDNRVALLGGESSHGPVDDGEYWRTTVTLPRRA